jgi:F-type H+-transporting ATPase subunit gamma
MAKTRELVQRRKALGNIRKITRTMELIATARFKKAMDRATEAAAYTRKIAELAADLSANAGDVKHPLLETRPVKNSVLLVLCSNRGLCGGYNASILREATARLRQVRGEGINLSLELSGKRAMAYFRYQREKADQTYTQFEDKPRFEEVDLLLAERYIRAYTEGKIDRLDVAYMKFLNAARQIPIVETLLPLSALATQAAPRSGPAIEYEYMPNAANILEELLPVSFKARLFKCFLDSAVSEQIARRVAMKNATDNAEDMIRDLSIKYNRARQAQITKDIAEVIGGAAALE